MELFQSSFRGSLTLPPQRSNLLSLSPILTLELRSIDLLENVSCLKKAHQDTTRQTVAWFGVQPPALEILKRNPHVTPMTSCRTMPTPLRALSLLLMELRCLQLVKPRAQQSRIISSEEICSKSWSNWSCVV
jgi:hypothetical protein